MTRLYVMFMSRQIPSSHRTASDSELDRGLRVAARVLVCITFLCLVFKPANSVPNRVGGLVVCLKSMYTSQDNVAYHIGMHHLTQE